MRLLFDENLSFRLVDALAEAYPESVHVRDAGLLGAPEERIWAYAAERQLLVVSKDTDFYQRSLLFGLPPEVVWLRVGNAPTSAIATLLLEGRALIERFYEDPEASFLPLG